MSKPGWTVVYQVELPGLLAPARRSLDEQLIDAARTLVQLILPNNPFWKSEQGLRLFRDRWQLEYRVDPEAAVISVLGGSALAKSEWTGWTVRCDRGVKLPLSLRAPLTELLTDSAETLADLVHPHSPFWNSDQKLRLEVGGCRIHYRVDQEALRIFVSAVEAIASDPQPS